MPPSFGTWMPLEHPRASHLWYLPFLRLRLIQLSETARVTPVIQNAEYRRLPKAVVSAPREISKSSRGQARRFKGAMPSVQARGKPNRGRLTHVAHTLMFGFCNADAYGSLDGSHEMAALDLEAKIKETEAELARLQSDHKEPHRVGRKKTVSVTMGAHGITISLQLPILCISYSMHMSV